MRSTVRLLLAGAAVLFAGSQFGTAGALVVGQLLAALGLLALLGGLPPRSRAQPLRPLGSGRQRERFPGYVRLHGIVLMASDGRPLDRALRPTLQRIVEAQLGKRSAEDLRAHLGEQVWQLVDPARPAADAPQRGLDLDALAAVLDRLETL